MQRTSNQQNEDSVEVPARVQIRKYKDGDRARAVEVYRAAFCDGVDRTTYPLMHRCIFNWVDEMIPVFDDVRSMMKVENGGCLFMVLDSSGQSIGMIGLKVSDEDKQHRRAELVRMALVPGHRQRGIGNQMLEFIIEYARHELKCKLIWLSTSSNRWVACKMYEKYGFEEVSRERDGDMRDDAVDTWWDINMEKKL